MKQKIMLVDDNIDFTYAVKKKLEKIENNYEIISVNSGTDCINLLQQGTTPDLILLDIMMPDIDGWDVFAKIKENPTWKNIPIVFLTAKTDAYSKGFGKIAAADYIEKPFEIAELKQRIDNILSR